jgi:hypothetical protein
MWSPVVRLLDVAVPIGGIVAAEVVTPWGRVHHKGIVADTYGGDGQPRIVHASNFVGAVVETDASEFLLRAVGPVYFVGYPGELPPGEVLRRARARLGEPYRMLRANCEHFVTGVHGLEPTSSQLRSTAGVTATALVALAVVGGIIALASTVEA